jgi:hypothetical protein
MEIFRDAVSLDTIDIFRRHHQTHSLDQSLNHINRGNIDVRTLITEDTNAFDEIKKICQKHFPDVKDGEIYANYQRQSNPTFMHVDEFGTDREEKTWTIIIPMHTDERLSVVILKNYFNNNEDLKKFVMEFDYEKSTKKNDVSKQVLLTHTPNNWRNPSQYLADYMDLDGVFKYKIGDYVLFDTNQAHASSDFKIYPEYAYKDLVQIHIGKSASRGHNPYYTEK